MEPEWDYQSLCLEDYLFWGPSAVAAGAAYILLLTMC